MSTRVQRFIGAALASAGVNMPGDIHVLTRSGAYAPYALWQDWVHENRFHTTLDSTLLGKMTGGRNDVLLVSPDSHSLGASLTWNKNMTHMVGSYEGSLMNVRNRLGMSTAFTPMLTVSGYGNIFANIYTMHGTAAADYVGWAITGNRNRFYRCHFGGPMVAAQGGHASYEGITVDGSENVFEKCIIGTDTIGRDEVSPNVTLGAGTLTIFRDCLFLCNLTDGDPIFVKVENTTGYTWALFERCTFMAFNSNYATAMTKAFDFTGGASCAMVFDGNCNFQNVSALSAAAEDQYIWLPRVHATTTDTQGLINVKLTI